MKGFFKWFKSSTKMKRWIFLILLGIILACYGMAEVITLKEISFEELAKVIAVFVVGFTFVILGLIFSQKRVLELLIEETDDRLKKNSKDSNVKSLIFNKKVYNQGPNVVVIGGGNGLNTVLKGLKRYTDNITAIVTVSNYGIEPTISRKQLDLLPLDDIKESIVALSYDEELMENLLNRNFNSSKLQDVNFGDLYFSAMNEIYLDFSKSIEKSSQVLNITGKVLPVTLDEMQINAELEDGTVIEKKDDIPQIVMNTVSKISRIYITPSNCKVAPGVLEAISNADAIIIGPGSLYTNVIPNLLVKNVSKTIRESKAIKIYVSNIMTEPGQTDNYSVSDHLDAIFEHAGNDIIDYCIYDTGEIVPEYIKMYNQNGADIVEHDIQKLKTRGVKLLQRNLSCIIDGTIRHDTNAVAESIIQLICNDLKYKDKYNDPQYVMLNTKLKEEKKRKKPIRKIEKIEHKYKKKEISNAKHSKVKVQERKSKFNKKYKDRIESIQTSDEKKLENMRREQQEKEDFLKEINKD